MHACIHACILKLGQVRYLISYPEQAIGDDGVVHFGLEGPKEAVLAQRVARLGAAQCGERVARGGGTLGPRHRITNRTSASHSSLRFLNS